MKYLADTHILIWALRDDSKLSLEGRKILLNANNIIYYSVINIWEIAIKHTLHKENFNFSSKTFHGLCIKSGYKMLTLEPKHIFTIETLQRSDDAPRHRDPFDRLLLAQAKAEGMSFLSHDTLLEGYHEPCLVNI